MVQDVVAFANQSWRTSTRSTAFGGAACVQAVVATRTPDGRIWIGPEMAAWVRERTRPRPKTGETKQVTHGDLVAMQKAAVAEADRWLRAQARRLPWQPGPDDLEKCLAQLRALVNQLFPYGIASAMVLDDRVLPTEPSTRRLLERPHEWTPVPGWRELLALIEDLKVGGAGLVIVERPGRIGHAFAIVHTIEGLRIADPQNGGVINAEDALPSPFEHSAVDPPGEGDGHSEASEGQAGQSTTLPAPFQLRVLLVDPTGQVIGGANTASGVTSTESISAPAARAVSLAGTDPVEPRVGGSGWEREFTLILGGFDPSDYRGALLATNEAVGISIVVETKGMYRGSRDGLYYRTENAALESGNAGCIAEEVAIPEEVAGVFRVFDDEQGYRSGDKANEMIGISDRNLDNIGGSGSRPRWPLRVAYPARNGWKLTRLGKRAKIGPRPVGDWPGAHVHHTFGVPIEDIDEFLEHVETNTWRDESKGYYTRALLADGRAFARHITGRFISLRSRDTQGLAPSHPKDIGALADVFGHDPAIRKLRGLLVLLYEHVAALTITVTIDMESLRKVYLAALSRVEMYDLLDLMDAEIKEYLTRDNAYISNEFVRTLRTSMPDFDQRVSEFKKDPPGTTYDVLEEEFKGLLETSSVYKLQDYLNTGLKPDHRPRVKVMDAFGGLTVRPVDTANDRMEPRIPLEIRSYGARHVDGDTAKKHHQAMSDVLREIAARRWQQAGPVGPSPRQTTTSGDATTASRSTAHDPTPSSRFPSASPLRDWMRRLAGRPSPAPAQPNAEGGRYGGSGRGYQPKGSARGDDPVALRWPVGHRITVEPVPALSTSANQPLTLEPAPPGRTRTETAGPGSLDLGEVRLDELTAEQLWNIGNGIWSGKPRDPGFWRAQLVPAHTDPAVWVLERRFDEITPRTDDVRAGAGVGVGASAETPRVVLSYRVTATGAIELPDGERISSHGWVRHGVDFFNIDGSERLVVLRGDSGWVGIVDNADTLRPALEDRYREIEPDRYQARIQHKAFYLTPIGTGEPVWIGPLPKNFDGDGIAWRSGSTSENDCVNVAVIWPNSKATPPPRGPTCRPSPA